MRPSQGRCHAVVGDKRTCQIEWVQLCQQKATRMVSGVPLCGTHINAAYNGPIQVIGMIEGSDET